MLWQMPQQQSQMLKRKFADGQNLLRLAASHALTLVSLALCPANSQTFRFLRARITIRHNL
jgi:hypothetical protein